MDSYRLKVLALSEIDDHFLQEWSQAFGPSRLIACLNIEQFRTLAFDPSVTHLALILDKQGPFANEGLGLMRQCFERGEVVHLLVSYSEDPSWDD